MKNVNLSFALSIVFVLLIEMNCFSQTGSHKVIRLYKGAAPGSEESNWKESVFINKNDTLTYNVIVPTLTVYPADKSQANGTAVVVCPGGAWHSLAMKGEGADVADWLNKKGITVFVLKYRLVHCLTDNPNKEWLKKLGAGKFYKEAESAIAMGIADGKVAIRYVRDHAAEWDIKANRIGIMGFSAGGTVATGVAFTYDAQSRPDFVAPIYPYYGGFGNPAVPIDAPPMFIAVASNDGLGFNKQCMELYNRWFDAGKSAELHIYRAGAHGFAMRKQNIPTDTWIERFYEWLNSL